MYKSDSSNFGFHGGCKIGTFCCYGLAHTKRVNPRRGNDFTLCAFYLVDADHHTVATFHSDQYIWIERQLKKASAGHSA